MSVSGFNRRDGFVEGLTAGMFGSAVCTSALLYVLRQQDLVTFDALPMPAWFRGGDGRIQWVNRAYVTAVEAQSAHGTEALKASDAGPSAAYIWKTTADPFVGKTVESTKDRKYADTSASSSQSSASGSPSRAARSP